MTHQDAVETMAAERYLLDEMSELERHTFEEHFFACGECVEDMRLGHRLRNHAQAIFQPERSSNVLYAPQASRWRRAAASVVLPWAAAAVLAVGLIYQTRAPGVSDEIRALAPVALRPASRGALPTVTVQEKGQIVALALDVNTAAPGDQLAYRLEGETGAAIATGRVMAPAAGTPLLLLVPAERLRAGGSFVLTLTTGGSAGPQAEYRFNATAR
jgi:anti-sigma factor RsiW